MQDERLLLEAARKSDERLAAKLERLQKLEQLVKEGIPLMDKYTFPGTKDADAWTARAKALLEQETK